MIEFIEFITIILSSLIMGVFWGTWLSLSRSIDSFTLSEFLSIGKRMIKNLAIPMRILMPITLLFILYLTFLFALRHLEGSFYLALAGFIFISSTLIITLTINVPIDYQIKKWAVNSAPSNWENIRRRWELFHAIRTFLSIAAFSCIALACISS